MKNNRYFLRVFSFLFVFLFLASFFVPPVVALAEELSPSSLSDFDNTSVLSDLQNAVIDGKKFDTNNYPKGLLNDDPVVLSFLEYCYSLESECLPYYGLYLYVYNPSGLRISTGSLANKVQIAFDYDANNNPVDYEKLHLTVCDCTADHLLYKLKIDERVSEIYRRVSSQSERRYDVSSIELQFVGVEDVVDYKVGGTWIYSGYAKSMDYSSKDESTLSVSTDIFDVISLEVHPASYNASSGPLTGNNVSSVYFSVPNSVLRNYGNLYSIEFEAYKQLSSPMFVVYEHNWLIDSDNCYDAMLSCVGLDFSAGINNQYPGAYWGSYRDLSDDFTVGSLMNSGMFNYQDISGVSGLNRDGILNKIAWVLKGDENGKVSSDELLSYMHEYSNSFGKDFHGYSSDLFDNKYHLALKVEEQGSHAGVPSNGVISRTLDASGRDDFNLVTLRDPTFWQNILSLPRIEDLHTFSPIQEVVSSDFNLLKADFTSKYYVDESDVSAIQGLALDSVFDSSTPFIFHFDISPYVEDSWNYVRPSPRVGLGNAGYVVQEYLFLDFDVIQLGFRKNDVVTNIPVCSNPIDVIPSIAPNYEFEESSSVIMKILSIILFVLAVLITLWIFSTIVLPLLRGVFRLIKSLFSKKNKRK